MSFLKKILGQKGSERNYDPKITVEKMNRIFEYGKQNNLSGTGDDSLRGKYKVGHLINWEAEPYFYKGYKDIPAQIVPANIKWSNNPVFAYVSILDNKVQYHYREDGGSAVYICPTTNNIEHVKLIDEIFEHYYHRFGLSNILNQKNAVKEKADKSDKLKFLTEYLTTTDEDFFNDNFCDDDKIYDIAMWIDWREEDENIITSCEGILQTQHLAVKTQNANNERGFDTIITYKNQETSIPYKGAGADRNTTIIALNQTLHPEFEIRLCRESLGSDTLCFLPLTTEQWSDLDTKYSKKVDERFKRITIETTMFE